jgi:ectoine hydroxylase-related dioxygenase (phytanoyl-CoA dioxygenase family)
MSPEPDPVREVAARYREEGFAVAAGLLTEEELAAVRSELDRYLETQLSRAEPGEVYYEDLPGRPVRCVFRMHLRSEFFLAMLDDARLRRIVEAVLDDPHPVPDGVMLIDKAPGSSYEFPYHQDNAYQFWTPPESVAATLALDPSTEESGTIVCLRRSHTLAVLPHRPSGILGASLGLVAPPDVAAYPEVPLHLRPGDLALHHAQVVHRTGPNRTRAHRRNLGFAYHSSRARRDEAAQARYQEHLRRIAAGQREERVL